jgi:threonine efflux protein
MSDYWAFAGVMLLGQFSPGPDMLLLMQTALRERWRAGLATVAGIATGLTFHASVAIAGFSAVATKFPWAMNGLSLLGGLYLLNLSLRLLSLTQRASGEDSSAATMPLTIGQAYRRGLWTNLLNPKAIVFLAGVCAAMLGAQPSGARQIIFGAIVIGQALVFWSLFVWLLQRGPIGDLYRRSETLLNLAFGLALGFIAIRALWAGAGGLLGDFKMMPTL